MKRKLRFIGILLLLVIIPGALWLYSQNQKRDVAATASDLSLTVETLVTEYLSDPAASNAKYLSANGESKILELEGLIFGASNSSDGRILLVLKPSMERKGPGIQCLFVADQEIVGKRTGDLIRVKGVLRAGPENDEDFGLYENGYLEECVFVN